MLANRSPCSPSRMISRSHQCLYTFVELLVATRGTAALNNTVEVNGKEVISSRTHVSHLCRCLLWSAAVALTVFLVMLTFTCRYHTKPDGSVTWIMGPFTLFDFACHRIFMPKCFQLLGYWRFTWRLCIFGCFFDLMSSVAFETWRKHASG